MLTILASRMTPQMARTGCSFVDDLTSREFPSTTQHKEEALKPPRQLIVMWLQASQCMDRMETASIPTLLQKMLCEKEISPDKVRSVGPRLF